MEHFPGHQQALIKNNIVVVVLSFPTHDANLMYQTFQKFNYDQVIDLCRVHLSPGLGDAWDGKKFVSRPFPSWTLGEDLKWHPPVEKPDSEDNYIWNEEEQEWQLCTIENGCLINTSEQPINPTNTGDVTN